jgi:hypothetical protein
MIKIKNLILIISLLIITFSIAYIDKIQVNDYGYYIEFIDKTGYVIEK